MKTLKLTRKGADILRRGGHDDLSDDDMLVLELAQRMPGESVAGLMQIFIALHEQYGEDALHALKSGHVKIEPRQ
jgi:hypothetical protein